MHASSAGLPVESPLVGTTVDETQSVPTAVLGAVAAATDTRAADLPPLYRAIDPDALVRVVRSQASGYVAFSYGGCEVVVYHDGSVEVYDE